ncbi:MAG: TolC family protein [Fuerstiella sp.]
MRFDSLRTYMAMGLLSVIAGCVGSSSYVSNDRVTHPPRAVDIKSSTTEPPVSIAALDPCIADRISAKARQATYPKQPSNHVTAQPEIRPSASNIQTVSHAPEWDRKDAPIANGSLTIEGRTYRMQLLDENQPDATAKNSNAATLHTVSSRNAVDLNIVPQAAPPALNSISNGTIASNEVEDPMGAISAIDTNVVELNLPTALSMIGGQHPAVGFAQWKVQEAYASLEQAEVLWLPSIRTGFSFHRHDGNFQASNGAIVDVNRNSFQYGLGSGSTGAGTTPNPGIVAEFHLADAIFQPKVARKTAWASGHAATGVVNQQLLSVALAYLELLDAEQDSQIIQASYENTSTVAKLTADFASTGQGLQADADRLETELMMIKNRMAAAQERAHIASARLAEVLSLDGGRQIMPLDPTVVPIDLVALDQDKGSLISTGLSNRPELKEAQALVAAACDRYQRQKYAPFVPSVLLGFSTGASGGGLGNNLSNVDSRFDIDAMVSWEVRNLGFGERAARKQTEAQVQQAKFQKIRLLDQVAREVSESYSQVTHRSQRLSITQAAIQSAQNSYDRNVSRIRDGQGLPLEVLQSAQALEGAQRAYLQSVVAYNEAQFRLQWSLGWPVFAPNSGN